MGKYTWKFEEIDDLLKGLTLYGTGGGGEAEWGRVILENEFRQGRVCELIAPEEVEDDAFVCSGGIMGSVKSLVVSYEGITADWEKSFPLLQAIEAMEKLKGRKVDYLIPFEVGALNTPVIMSAAARLGIPMIDGDANGRSAPETQMTSFIGCGINLYPMPLVDRYGNTTIVMHGNESTYADEVGRFIVVKGGGMGANAHYPMSGAEVKRACVPHSVSHALTLAKLVNDAAACGKDPVEAFRAHYNGKLLFEGVVTKMEGVDKGGFYLTDLEMRGENDFTSHGAKMVVKNESMAVWVDGEPAILFPDRAFMLDPKTGYGIPSVTHEVGLHMAIVGVPCHERVRACLATEAGRSAYGGARYGYPELPYVPFEEL